MITDIHEKIKEQIRTKIKELSPDSIIVDFMSYSLPYRTENADKYAGDDPWCKIAKKIKENPNVLKSQEMAYAISASFRVSNQIYATDEFDFSLDIMDKLKVLKEDGIITEAEFQEVLALKSPETGETLLTKIMKDALNLTRGSATMQMFNRVLDAGVDVNFPNAREQYPFQIMQHFYNVRKRNIEYSIEKGLVSKDFVSSEYIFPNEKRLIEEKTTKETLEKIKLNTEQKDEVKPKFKKTPKVRAYVTISGTDVSTWRENGPQGYAYAISVAEPTYIMENFWAIDTLILPGKYVVYEGRGEEQQLISVDKFYNGSYCLYLLDSQGKKLKAVDSKEILKTLAGGQAEKTLTTPNLQKVGDNVVKQLDKTIAKNLDIKNLKTGLKQLEGASNKLFKKITGKLFKK